MTQKRIFINWTNQDSRALSLSHHLEAGNFYVHGISAKSRFLAPFKYVINTMITMKLLIREDPDVIFVLNPPVFAVLVVWIYCSLRNRAYIVDTHSGAFTYRPWAAFLWLYRFLARRSLLNILHNSEMENRVSAWGASTASIGDIPFLVTTKEAYPLKEGFSVVCVNRFSKDEPLEAVLAAARMTPSVNFYVTGPLARAPKSAIKESPDNVIFTDFLPWEKYKALLAAGDLVICLTTNDNTMQNGAYEALQLGRPVITSDWPVLRRLYYKGAICIDNSPGSLAKAITEIRDRYPEFSQEILELKDEFNANWEKKRSLLLKYLNDYQKTRAKTAAVLGETGRAVQE